MAVVATNNSKRHALFAAVWLLCWLCVASMCLSSDVEAAITPADCRPQRKMTVARCAARIRQCKSLGIGLKWTGKGCRQGRTRAKDGGCQCQSYCGYTCKQACNSDRTCIWNTTQAQCYSRATGEPGQAQATCNLPSSTPTIPTPTTSPSTSPVTSLPTTSPSEQPPACPSLSPTSSPTQFGQMLSGVQINIPVPPGWNVCFCDTYDVPMNQSVLASIQSACTKTNLMLACRPVGSTDLTVAAMAPRVDVLTDTGTSNTPHNANGVGWYFSETSSWGFAAQGDSIARNDCDTVSGATRLCWHTSASDGGYRCGSTEDLNDDSGWVRLVYQAD